MQQHLTNYANVFPLTKFKVSLFQELKALQHHLQNSSVQLRIEKIKKDPASRKPLMITLQNKILSAVSLLFSIGHIFQRATLSRLHSRKKWDTNTIGSPTKQLKLQRGFSSFFCQSGLYEFTLN